MQGENSHNSGFRADWRGLEARLRRAVLGLSTPRSWRYRYELGGLLQRNEFVPIRAEFVGFEVF